MRFPVLCLLFFFTGPAAADDVILMVNMNYSVEELKALEKIARDSGQQLVVVPPKSLTPLAEALFRQRDGLMAKMQKLRPGWSIERARAVVSDYMRRGLKSSMDPELNAQLSQEIQDLHRNTRAHYDKEAELGPLNEQIKKKVAEIKADGHFIQRLVISAHSDGASFSSETSYLLSSNEIANLEKEAPALFQEPRHVLLLSCYNLTGLNRPNWRPLFPAASLVAGFGKKAPSRYNELSSNFVKEVLTTADKLDPVMLKSGGPLAVNSVVRAFRALASVTGTDSVIDYCLQIVEGKAGSQSESCTEQWERLGRSISQIEPRYMDLRRLSVNPPQEGGGGELRVLYNYLHLTCPAEVFVEESPQLRNASPQKKAREARAMEDYRIRNREILIRLMNWGAVQTNFGTYFAQELSEFPRALRALAIEMNTPLKEAPLPMDGTTGRVEFVQQHRRFLTLIEKGKERYEREKRRSVTGLERIKQREKLQRMKKTLDDARSLFAVYEPILKLYGNESLRSIDNSDTEQMVSRGAVPLHWIAYGAVLDPRRN